MKKKTILTALILFLSYTIFVSSIAPKYWTASQSQNQYNVIKAQKFLYDIDSIKNVIVGSSLSCRIINDSLKNTYNLSLNGLSIFEGLKILIQKKKLPENVFIEMNVVSRSENIEFTNTLISPISFYPKKMLLSLREDKQPLVILAENSIIPIQRFFENFKNKVNRFYFNKDKPNIKIDNKELFSKILNERINEFSKVPDSIKLAQNFFKLKKDICYLESKNVNIIFFYMPVNYKLNNLLLTTHLKKEFQKYFSIKKYEYLFPAIDYKYETTDGIHLKDDEALYYTMFLKHKKMQFFN